MDFHRKQWADTMINTYIRQTNSLDAHAHAMHLVKSNCTLKGGYTSHV